ncbi:MAG: TRAP transporter substrate-binding protein DctP [Bacteriovoracaceae bacterium]
MIKNLILLIVLFFTYHSMAASLKLAVLVPEGTTWGNSLKKLAKEVETASQGEVSFKVYYGGVAGDEPDVLRKIRIGQLHGGIFTGKTLGDISGDVRSMEIPFTFYNDQAKASRTLIKLAPTFSQSLKKKGFTTLGFYEIGQVYVVTTKPVATLNDLKGLKIWAWEGDELVKAMIESLELVSVPLALPDVLSSLSTGIINAAYAPPLGIIALQWHTKIKYLVDFPSAFSIGALVISDKAWSGIKPEVQQKIMSISQKLIKEANEKNVVENQQAREQLKKAGVHFVQFPEADYKKAASARTQVIQKIKDRYISSQIIQTLDKEAK